MKLGIYQSYIKEPQKFFAPSTPCKANANLMPIKPLRKYIINQTPIILQFEASTNLSQPASPIGKLMNHKKSASIQLTKVELILDDIFHQQRGRSEKLRRDVQFIYRPNTSKPCDGKKMCRPLTVNAKYLKKGFLSKN